MHENAAFQATTHEVLSEQRKPWSVASQPLPRGVLLYVRLILFLTALPFLYLAEVAYTGGPALQARLWSPSSDRFGDFWHYRVLLQSIHTPEFFAAKDRFAYPAPCAILYQWLYHLGSHPHVSFNLLLWAAEAVSAVLLLRALVRRRAKPLRAAALVLLMALSSYPWHMLYDRGNIEILLYILIASGVWAWLEGRGDVAAVLWGCAGAFKIYPLLLLAFYAKRGEWRRFTVGMITCVSLLLLSFWYVGPTIKLAANGTMWGIRGFVGTYGAHSRYSELAFDHSLLGAMKEISSLPIIHGGEEQIVLSHVYEALVALFAPIAFVRWRKNAPPANQLCLLLLGMVALPPVSYDYTLIYAYLVIGLVVCDYVAATARGDSYPGWKAYFVSFALLCTTEVWVNLAGLEPNGLLKAAALLTLAFTLVRYPLRGNANLVSQAPEAVPAVVLQSA